MLCRHCRPQQSVQTLSLQRSYRLVLAGAGPELSAACLMRLDVATYGHRSFDRGGARGDPFLRCKFDVALTALRRAAARVQRKALWGG
jgi:hypothetical protein